jgi:hypothetical protein
MRRSYLHQHGPARRYTTAHSSKVLNGHVNRLLAKSGQLTILSTWGHRFDTLGRIVEIASGQSFDRFLQQRLFEPLGMRDVSFFASDALASRMPTPYLMTPTGVQ